MFALLLVAVSVGLSNFAASAGLGVSGLDRTLRLRVALVFGVFEGVMPIIGLVLGRSLAHDLGAAAAPLAGALLGAVGVYAIVTALPSDRRPAATAALDLRRLVLIGAALSLDNLVIGFALGSYHVNLVVAATVIAAVSVGLSLLGLEIGGRLGTHLGQRGEVVGGAVLVLVGVAVGVGVL